MPTLTEFNQLFDTEATVALARCCGASRWVAQMLTHRPFDDEASVYQTADQIWWALTPADWLEAFRHHPKIGDVASLRQKFATTADWSANEQSGVNSASEETLYGLADGNQAYEDKFGFIFIVCATGKTAAEMLDLLRARLLNEAEAEIKIAAEEQRKITRIRLGKMFSS